MHIFTKFAIIIQFFVLNMTFALPQPKIFPGTTLVINEKLSDGANLFLYSSPQIAAPIFAQYIQNPILAGREAYEAVAKEFANEEPGKKLRLIQ